MAAKIITIAIEKGGTGKTVTASNLAYLMGDEGKKVLCVDTDPQGNLTTALSGGNTIASGVYNGKALFNMFDGFLYTKTKDFITETEYENVDMIPCSVQTTRISKRLQDLLDDTKVLDDNDPKKVPTMGDFLYYFLNQVRSEYDYIIIDTQPTRDSLLLSNAIAAADYVLIPAMCDANSEESAYRLYSNCNEMRKNPKSHIKGIGVVLISYDKNAAADRMMRGQFSRTLGDSLYKTEIPISRSVKMSISKHLPICYMAKTQPVAKAYVEVYKELKERLSDMEER